MKTFSFTPQGNNTILVYRGNSILCAKYAVNEQTISFVDSDCWFGFDELNELQTSLKELYHPLP